MKASGMAAGAKPIRAVEVSEYPAISDLEADVIWTFPLLNERLHLCRTMGRKVSPGLELLFERPIPLEYQTYVDMISSHGSLEDWGYRVPESVARSPRKR